MKAILLIYLKAFRLILLVRVTAVSLSSHLSARREQLEDFSVFTIADQLSYVKCFLLSMFVCMFIGPLGLANHEKEASNLNEIF